MGYVEYFNAALAKGTIGSYISIGVFGLIAVYAFFGVYYGGSRGFSKSVIRLFTVASSAVLSLLTVGFIAKTIVKAATGSAGGEAQSLEALLDSYSPGIVDSLPGVVRPILSEVNSATAAIFVMMIIAVIITPVLFIGIFYILKFATFFLYQLLSGLAGAISYGRNALSIILGAAVGLIQGVLIASVIIIPISGLCNVAMEARPSLMKDGEEHNEYVEMAYATVIDDLADNPVFDLVDKFGGSAVYESMITVKIDGKKMDMGEECVGLARVIADIMPVAKPGFDWTHPSLAQRNSLKRVAVDIGENDLLAALISDVLRGTAIAIDGGAVDLGLSGAAKTLVHDIMLLFSTTTPETVQGDLDMVLDLYFIVCDRNLIDTFKSGDPDAVVHALIDKDENGKSSVDLLLDRLNEYDRGQTIITSLTKLSLAMMQDALGFDEDTQEIYDNVKEDITNVLNHNKSDFETEEEYKQAVSNDLDQALKDNNLHVDEEVKQGMVDYIADNYGDHEGEITDKEITDALLSYYQSYSDYLANGGNLDELPEGIIPGLGGGEGEGEGEGSEE